MPADPFSGSYSETTGPFRLGVTILPIDTSVPHNPQFWTNYRAEYAWFADENTTKVSTMCGVTVTQHANRAPNPLWGNAADPGMTPRNVGAVGELHFGLKVNPAPYSAVALSSLVTDGWTVDTSELPGPVMSPSGGGATHGIATGTQDQFCWSPYRLTYDLDVTKFGLGTTGAHLLDRLVCVPQTGKTDPVATNLICPVSTSYLIPSTDWPTHYKLMVNPLALDIDPMWAATQPVPLDVRDLAVPLWANPAKIDPSSGGAIYSGVSALLQSSLSVEFPQGPGEPRPSHWSINDGAYGSVTENAGNTVFHVTDARAVFTRTLLSHWRTWTASPFPHGVDAYEVTKHDQFGTTEDVWAWDAYGWLQVTHTGPSAGAATLRIDGVWLEVNDPHTTGSDRATGYSQTEHPFGFTYDLPVSSGAGAPFIDLLFPAAGGTNPVYPSRVDKITLSELPVGDTTVSDIRLVARHDGYLKVDYGPPVQRLDYSCLHASQDGAFQWGNWPDEALKPDETGSHPPYGGALRYIDPLTGSETGTILDSQYDLATFCGHWNRLEGWIVSHDAGAFASANQDGFGNAIGPEYASWLRPLAPHLMYATGTAFHPPCGPVVREMLIPNGRNFTVYTRWPIWGALEALIPAGAGRAAAGVAVSVIRDDTGATVLTAHTDASGYVACSPIPANGVRSYHLEW